MNKIEKRLKQARDGDTTSQTFTDIELSRIEDLARGLSKSEVLQCFYLDEDELTQYDKYLFEKSYAKGRAQGKAMAVANLFNQMNGRDGVKGALAYLVRFGDDWPEVTEEGTKNGQTSFKIVMPSI